MKEIEIIKTALSLNIDGVKLLKAFDNLLSEHTDEIAEKDEKINDLLSEINELDVSYEEIDFGIGKLEFLPPDNLRVIQFMDTLKELFHGHTLS